MDSAVAERTDSEVRVLIKKRPIPMVVATLLEVNPGRAVVQMAMMVQVAMMEHVAMMAASGVRAPAPESQSERLRFGLAFLPTEVR